MAWDEATNSTAVFRSWLADTLSRFPPIEGAWANPARYQLACFDATVTPDRNATTASCYYGSGTWTVGAEVTDQLPPFPGKWPTAGVGIGTAMQAMPDGFGLATAPLTKGPVTMIGAAGDLQIDLSTPLGLPGQGVAYHYWGGITDVTAGSLTITWFNNLLVLMTF
jgi:hypothetical protein